MENNFFISEFAKSSLFRWDFLKNFKSQDQWNYLANAYDNFLLFKENENSQSLPSIIPRKIHQIWIGNKLPRQYSLWMKTWKKLNPEWDYILWDDEMINKFNLVNKVAYNASDNPGFKSDIARYEILNKFGGLYVDTDFECLKKIPDYLLKYEFVSSIVFANSPILNNAIIFAKADSNILKNMINSIRVPINSDPYEIMNISGPYALSKNFFNLSTEEKKKTIILPTNIFYPYPNFMLSSKIKKEEFITEESIAIHHWGMSWIKKNKLLKIYKFVIYLTKKFIYLFDR